MKALFKTFIISLQFILATSFLMVLHALIMRRGINLTLIFNANFFIGMLIISVGLVVMLLPARFLKLDKLMDHSTFIQRHVEFREQKQEKAYGFIFLGIMVIVNTGLIQMALWAFIM